mmetsp:Transcript_2048/g.5592  ORF Transcript_2048/g.5592 Transcript_2048/m.5592 type:complete len:204 (+) Transcript_2048:94-705(+)
MLHSLYELMNFATKASRWMMGLVPSRSLCSKVAAIFTISYLSSSSNLHMSSCASLAKIRSAGTQFTRSLYSISLTWNRLFGVCSFKMLWAISLMKSSHSGSWISWFSSKGYRLILQVSSMRRALRMLLLDPSAILSARVSGSVSLSFSATWATRDFISPCFGALTLTHTHLDCTGSMTLLRLVQVITSLHCLLYFSMVLLRAC